jgi:hypothetical protein
VSGPSADELIAKPESTDWFEGAGLVSDVADLAKVGAKANDGPGFDPSRISTPQATIALGGAGLSALAAKGNPIETLAEAGLGWLIEHVDFLREPLDQLAGDPNEIKAHAQTWHNVGRELGLIADDQERELERLGAWQGVAADAYRLAAGRQADVLRRNAGSAEELAGEILSNAATVAAVRSVVRDMIVDFVMKLAEWAIGALATAPATAGASIAAVIAGAVASAARTAERIATLVAKLLEHLAEAGTKLGKLAGTAQRLASELASGANGLRKDGDAVAGELRRFAQEVAPPREPQPLPGMLTGEDRRWFEIDLPTSARDAVNRFVEGQLSPEHAAAVAAEPAKQAGAAERDREKWTPL